MYKVKVSNKNKTIKTKLYQTDESFKKYFKDFKYRHQCYQYIVYKLINDQWVEIPDEE